MKNILIPLIVIIFAASGGYIYIGYTNRAAEVQRLKDQETQRRQQEIEEAKIAEKVRKLKEETAEIAIEVKEMNKEKAEIIKQFANSKFAKQQTSKQQDNTSNTYSSQQAPASYQLNNPVCQQDRSKAKSDIKASLSDKYDGHYSTISMLLDSNMKAYDRICIMNLTEPAQKSLSRLNRTYYPHFSTILLLHEKNMEAFEKLSN